MFYDPEGTVCNIDHRTMLSYKASFYKPLNLWARSTLGVLGALAQAESGTRRPHQRSSGVFGSHDLCQTNNLERRRPKVGGKEQS